MKNKKTNNDELYPAYNDTWWFHCYKNGISAYSNRYEWVGDFHNELAQAVKKEKNDKQISFHICKNGKPAYKERYDFVGPFFNEYAYALKGEECFLINHKGKKPKKLIILNKFNKISMFENVGINICKFLY